MNVEVAKIVGTYKPSPHHYPPTVPGGDVLAWKCTECGHWVKEPNDTTTCPTDWHPQSAQYTVDDLLRWLRRRYRHISIQTIDWGYTTPGCHCGDEWGNGADGCPHERYAESWTVRLSHVGASSDDIFLADSEDRSWTLLEALEAAVLAVPGDA